MKYTTPGVFAALQLPSILKLDDPTAMQPATVCFEI